LGQNIREQERWNKLKRRATVSPKLRGMEKDKVSSSVFEGSREKRGNPKVSMPIV
jgi:hypothetical protein